MRQLFSCAVLFLLICFLPAHRAHAQSVETLGYLVETPAVSGYEQLLAAKIRDELKNFSPQTDNLGNVYVTLGSGVPHRLIVTPMDEPGYIVSGITPDGFLRVQRLPQQAPHPVFDLLHSAQPIWVITRAGKKVEGVVAGLSVHLQPGRQNAPKMTSPEDIYIDIGAASEAEVRTAGVDLLDPIALNRHLYKVGSSSYTAPAIGDRFGCAVLIDLLNRLDRTKLQGTLTVAFATQQWTGSRGLDRLLTELRPDEMIYVGRLLASRAVAGAPGPSKQAIPGSGVLMAMFDASASPARFAAELKKLADANHVAVLGEAAMLPRSASLARPVFFPQRFAQLGVASRWPSTPGETIDDNDLISLTTLLESYIQAANPKRASDFVQLKRPMNLVPRPVTTTLGTLIQTYGASGHEGSVRDVIRNLVPEWAKARMETDAAGNLALHWDTPGKEKSPRIAFIAHMDELGYQVRSIARDGSLVVDVLGGGLTEYFLGHVVLVQTSSGTQAGVLELPNGWEKPEYDWQHNSRSMAEPVRVYVGANSAAEVEKLGIKTGDWITIPKEYRPLLGNRGNARSFDDRVGCAALVDAVRALGPSLPGRDVTFIWSTEEEVGLLGAAAAAERLSKEGRTPDFVFAIDTFVSSDSPLESKRFADTEIGKGFVIRAVDNSSIAPLKYVDRVIKLARDHQIPVQYGTTGGGNDGSVFQRYGSVDIPLSWPLRYSHSPGEVIDTRDLDALTRIVTVLAKNW